MSGYFFKQTTLILLGIAGCVFLTDALTVPLVRQWRDPIESVRHTSKADRPVVELPSERQLDQLDEGCPYERFRTFPAVYIAAGFVGLVAGLSLARLTGRP